MQAETETSNKYNLKDPRDADEAFRLTFLGDSTWTYTNIEANPGISGYGDTHFNPSVALSDPNSCHLSVYSMSDSAGEAIIPILVLMMPEYLGFDVAYQPGLHGLTVAGSLFHIFQWMHSRELESTEPGIF